MMQWFFDFAANGYGFTTYEPDVVRAKNFVFLFKFSLFYTVGTPTYSI